jgi:putative hemolysin
MPLIAQIFIILLMLVLNAIFAAYEMALTAVRRVKLSVLAQQKKKGAEEAIFMKERIEASLAVVQLGITLSGAIAAATGGISATDNLQPWLSQRLSISPIFAEVLALILVIIPLSCFTIIFSELVPKTFALNNKELVCVRLSPAMKILWKLFNPVIVFFEYAVKMFSRRKTDALFKTQEGLGLHELRSAASVARALRLIGAREEKIVHSTIQLSRRPVSEIFIPIAEISMIPVNYSLSEALVRAHLDMHTRFPVCTEDNNGQTIIGYVNFKDIIFALHVNPSNPTLQGIVRPIKCVKAQTSISSLLEEMIQESSHISLVRDDKTAILGMVTLEDLLEELVGDIKDEYDRLPNYIHPYFSGWIMGGGVTMDTVATTTGKTGISFQNLPGGRLLTLTEWCSSLKSTALKGGEVLEKDGLSITVRKLRRQQLAEAIVAKTS